MSCDTMPRNQLNKKRWMLKGLRKLFTENLRIVVKKSSSNEKKRI
ncbi:MAG: hypothetical protein WAK17_08480 [Candidatus Nitrosopolaris sp.]